MLTYDTEWTVILSPYLSLLTCVFVVMMYYKPHQSTLYFITQSRVSMRHQNTLYDLAKLHLWNLITVSRASETIMCSSVFMKHHECIIINYELPHNDDNDSQHQDSNYWYGVFLPILTSLNYPSSLTKLLLFFSAKGIYYLMALSDLSLWRMQELRTKEIK